jgi:Ras GTPase-activating-like protein IQGAP2/3
MAFNTSPRHTLHQYSPPRASPLRQSSNASTSSSAYSGSSYPSVSSYASTLASIDSNPPPPYPAGHKRGRSETEMAGDPTYRSSREASPTATYKSIRQSLRPLPQPPNDAPPTLKPTPTKHDPEGDRRVDSRSSATPTPKASRHHYSVSETLHRSGSLMRSSRDRSESHYGSAHSTLFVPPDLDELQRSSTTQLRNLSKLTRDSADEAFSISSSTPSVVGLYNRRQLKRNDSVRAPGRGQTQNQSSVGSQWSNNSWFDQQRQFLQAYEYLCHIGEAKEWIEDVIQKPIPPIVQLEEALRDGVTLAEIVQALQPHRMIRIFRHPKLQYRHSDNIASFFRFLNEVELPELFRFELIDLYEKKNIPKVIYCIHALSWLLYRNGMVSFRIGNLVGQLQFEHHELEEVQKGLDKSGVSMPSFSGMGATFGAEPEPEPAETEEERIARELSENELAIIDFQAQVRGCIVRLSLGNKMQSLWDAEDWLVEFQSRIRGDWARQVIGFRLEMMRFAINLQRATRGFLVRQRQQQNEANWHRQQHKVVALQSLFRARRARAECKWIKAEVRHHESGIREFQAAVRGVLERKRVQGQAREARYVQRDVEKVQAVIRGMLERKSINNLRTQLQRVEPCIVEVQALARGGHLRRFQARQRQILEYHQPVWRALQAVVRGVRSRERVSATRVGLSAHAIAFAGLQAKIRANLTREEVSQTRSALSHASESVTKLQGNIRALLCRKRIEADLTALHDHEFRFTLLEAISKGFLYRQRHKEFLQSLEAHTAQLAQVQALSRAMILRVNVGNVLADLEAVEESIEELQARARGLLIRASFAEKKRYFNENMQKVIKVQSYVRAKIQGEAYKSLTSGKNPPVGTVKNFVHLLNDSDFDFDEEVECERLRKTVVQHVRQNEMADQYIRQLDVKIALLVKNKITLDEVVKHQKHFGSMGGLLNGNDLASKDPFDLKALNKNSRRKLEQYQELFFILQTQPQYLARLFRHAREQTFAEKDAERMRHLIMGLFGYAQKRREEYYLLKLISRSLKEEIDGCRSVQEYLRGNFLCGKLFAAYVKSPRDRKFMRDTIGHVLKENIMDNVNLDLESDPLHIYHKAIENEQLRTGQRSHRRLNVPREEAIKDPETKKLFITHLQDLRDIVDLVFSALEDMLHKMPFGVRYIAQQIYNHLTTRFQREEPQHMLQIAGQWVWKNYLQPALLEPEKFGATDRALQGEQKKNTSEVAKVVNQIAMGRFFGAEEIFLQPLNSYIGESIERLTNFWSNSK